MRAGAELDDHHHQSALTRAVADPLLFDEARPAATTSRAPAHPNRPLLVGAAILTIVAGFGLGFVLSGSRTADRRELASGPTSTSSTAPSTTAPTTTSAVTTTVPTTIAPTTAPPTTVRPTTTVPPTTGAPPPSVVTVPTTPRTAPPTTAPPTTYAPPKVVVTFPADSRGRLVIPRNGVATITITNQGGLASQWIVTGSGFTISGGQSQGTINPGQSQFVMVAPPAGELPNSDVTGYISVLGATNSTVPFVIPKP